MEGTGDHRRQKAAEYDVVELSWFVTIHADMNIILNILGIIGLGETTKEVCFHS